MADNQLTPELLVMQKAVLDAQISPDGERVAYSVQDISKEGEHKRGSIHMVSFTGGDSRQLTYGPRMDSSPRWSPDGRSLAFLSDREKLGSPRLYMLPFGGIGGEATKLQTEDGDASPPKWSPDGRRIAFTIRDPETEEEKKRKEEKDDANVVDANLKYARLYVHDVQQKTTECLSPEKCHIGDFDWSPDSDKLVASVTETPYEDEYFLGCSIEVFSILESESDVVAQVKGPVSDLSWSTDGSRLAYVGMSGNDGTADSVYVLPVRGWQPRNLTEQYSGSVESVAWLDENTLAFSAYVELFGALNRVSLGGEISAILPEGARNKGSLRPPVTWSADKRRYATIRTSGTEAPDVWVGEVGGDLRRVTDTNPELEACLAPMTPVTWQATDGLEIQGLVIYPSSYHHGERYPLIVDVHGGPAWLWSDRIQANWHDWAQYLAANGYVVLLPNPRGSTGRGSAFTRANFDDIGGGEFTDLMAGVDKLIELGVADPDRLGIGGWSWGGYLSAWTVTQTDRFKAAVVGAGVTDLFSDQGQNDVPHMNYYYFIRNAYEDPEDLLRRSALYWVRDVTTPVLVLHGEADERVTVAQGRELYAALKYLGKPAEMVTYPREGHGFEERKHQLDLIKRVVAWYDKHLKDVPAEQS